MRRLGDGCRQGSRLNELPVFELRLFELRAEAAREFGQDGVGQHDTAGLGELREHAGQLGLRDKFHAGGGLPAGTGALDKPVVHRDRHLRATHVGAGAAAQHAGQVCPVDPMGDRSLESNPLRADDTTSVPG